MMFHFASFVLLILVLGCAPSRVDSLNAGGAEKPREPLFRGTGSHGSGGSEDSLAWFANGTRPIAYCIFQNAEGPKREMVRAAFEKGFEIVSEYYLSKQVHSKLSLEKRLATRLVYSENCRDSDLVIYPGTVETDGTLTPFERLALHAGHFSLNNPPSFKFRTDDPRDARTWGKGYIWVAKEALVDGKNFAWRLAPLVGLFAHEVGHIFGIDHVPGTLMDRDFAERLLELAYQKNISDAALLASYVQMDGSTELSMCESSACPLQNYHGILENEAFAKITGRQPLGEITARFYIRRFPVSETGMLSPAKFTQWAGTIADEQEDFRVFLEVDNRPLKVKTGIELFKNIFNVIPLNLSAFSYQARLHTRKGERVPVEILRNHLLADGESNRFYIGGWEGGAFFRAHTHQTSLDRYPSPKPDLQIEQVFPESSTALAVRVKNAGARKSWGTNLTVSQKGKWIGTSWVPGLAPGAATNVSLPLTGGNEIPAAGDLDVRNIGLGSDQMELKWSAETARIFRDQLFLPNKPQPLSDAAIRLEIDTWNSVLESNEANNVVLFQMRREN